MGGGVTIPVCIFAKPPVPAEVKTRLIPALGATGAAELASAMLRDVWCTVEVCPGVRPVLATTRAGEFPFGIVPADIWLQGEGDLGRRIARMIDRGLLEAPAVLVLGADSPTLTVAHLQAALDALQTRDAVVGPSTDGGFYLLGLRRSQAGLFHSVPWSSSQTLQALERQIKGCGLSLAQIEPLSDVDTPGDLLVLEQYLLANRTVAPATRDWCNRNLRRAPA